MKTYKVTYTSSSGKTKHWYVEAVGKDTARMVIALQLGFSGTPSQYKAELVQYSDVLKATTDAPP